MGHYYSEMFPNGRDDNFEQRWVDHQKKRFKEISDIVNKNPIKGEEIKVGDELKLYSPLLGKSRLRFNDKDEFEDLREFFKLREYSDINFWALAYADTFQVYGVRQERGQTHIRIDKPGKGMFDNIFPKWVNVRYFEREQLSFAF